VVIENEDYYFPDPKTSDEQGLLFLGGDLSTGRLLKAYSLGIFPWFQPGSPILWWSPDPRLILEPKHFHISHSLIKSLKKPWKVSQDKAFEAVMRACATTKGRESQTWITEEMIQAYLALHNQGYAHSVEIWDKEVLIGGLYGVSLGGVFFGESMFSIAKNASKIALYHLCQNLSVWEFDFIDCQFPTSHLISLGAKIIHRESFLYRLEQALGLPGKPGKWDLGRDVG
jgi:leucyl/phenylalanyl-tRNA---protein transferase